MFKTLQRALVVVGGTACLAAQAAFDTAPITDAITSALVAIAVVGAAVMGVHIAVKAYKWVRAAMA